MLGQLISPDTLVPDATSLLDYNRYGYARGNPMKFSDPSGHCATLSSGEPDENDGDCWRLAHTIATMWDDTDYWQERFGDVSAWNDSIAPSGATAEFFQGELLQYLASDEYRGYQQRQSELYERNRIPSTPVDPIDAIAVGIATNIDVPSILAGPLGASGAGGFELIAHSDGKTAIYPYLGGGVTFGAGVSTKVYVVRIHDLKSVDEYAGLSMTVDATLSLGLFGVTYGEFVSPSGAHGQMIGLAPGAGLSLSASGANYFPSIISWGGRR